MKAVSLSMVSAEGKKYSGESLSLDNMRFANCEFRDCHFLYSGGPAVMENCRIQNCEWKMQGTAAIVIESLTRCGWLVSAPNPPENAGSPN